MKFAFVARVLRYEGSGLHTMLVGLLQGIAQAGTDHEILLLVDPAQAASPGLGPCPFQVVPVSPSTSSTVGRLWWDHVAVGRACKRLDIDALYAPAHIRPAYTPCPVVVQVPDVTYRRFPHLWSRSEQACFRFAFSRFTARAARIVALSEDTKKDILSRVSIPPERVVVVYPGVPQGFRALPSNRSRQIRTKLGLSKPFVLSVGSFRPRTDLAGLVAAFERVAERFPHDLVIVAYNDWRSEKLLQRTRASPRAQRIRLLRGVDRPDMPPLLNEADLFVFPSVYEGFEFPVLEALACGCPTITTEAGSSPEVAGDAALLVPFDRTDDLGRAIGRVLGDTRLRARLSLRALERAQSFSWTTTAQQTLALLEEVALSGRPQAGQDRTHR